jgi:hypothetical protein
MKRRRFGRVSSKLCDGAERAEVPAVGKLRKSIK